MLTSHSGIFNLQFRNKENASKKSVLFSGLVANVEESVAFLAHTLQLPMNNGLNPFVSNQRTPSYKALILLVLKRVSYVSIRN